MVEKMHVVVIVPREVNISHNGNKSFVNYIMGLYTFITTGTM
jgi:hypothetical protein